MNTMDPDSDGNREPLFWVKGHPIFGAHFIVGVLSVSMILTGLIAGLGGSGFLEGLSFQTDKIYQGQVWRLFTYGLVLFPDIWTAVSLYLMWSFGAELEKFFLEEA